MDVFIEIRKIPVSGKGYNRSFSQILPEKKKIEEAIRDAFQKYKESLSGKDMLTSDIVKNTMSCARWISSEYTVCDPKYKGDKFEVCYCDRVFEYLLNEIEKEQPTV